MRRMRTRLWAMLLSVCLLLSLLPTQALAAALPEAGQTLFLPVIEEGEEAPAPQGVAGTANFGLVENKEGSAYAYAGSTTFSFNGKALIKTPDGESYMTERPASNGILQLLDKKPITVILPFAPSYSQQIFTRFQSLCDTFDAEILNQSCSTCLHHSPNFDTQFVISASKLMDSMNPKLSRLCFNRAFTKIHALLNHPEGMQIHYEAYAMFNILYNVRSQN